MAEEYLKVENLYKNYGNIKAVNNVSFSAKKGEIIALLGPNGAGKSTLMNMISGYLSPSSGEIFVCDKNIKNNPLWGKYRFFTGRFTSLCRLNRQRFFEIYGRIKKRSLQKC